MARHDNMSMWKINDTFGFAINCGYVYSPGGTNICSTGGKDSYAAYILITIINSKDDYSRAKVIFPT
jgi:hypothetical protein